MVWSPPFPGPSNRLVHSGTPAPEYLIVIAAVRRITAYEHVAAAVHCDGRTVIGETTVVAVGPERHARVRIFDRHIIGVEAIKRTARHKNVAAAVHCDGAGVIRKTTVVAVGPERYAALGVG